MFTGIVEEVGTIQSIKRGRKSSILKIKGQKVLQAMVHMILQVLQV